MKALQQLIHDMRIQKIVNSFMCALMVNNQDEMDVNLAKLLMKIPNDVIGHAKFPNGNNYLNKTNQFFIKFTKRPIITIKSKINFSADWYKGRLTDKQLDDLENPPTTTPKTRAKVSHRRKHPARKPQPQREEEEEEDAE